MGDQQQGCTRRDWHACDRICCCWAHTHGLQGSKRRACAETAQALPGASQEQRCCLQQKLTTQGWASCGDSKSLNSH